MSAAGREAKRSAFGHAAAKARRTRLAISTTRAAILMSLRRSVANSAFARSRDFVERLGPAAANEGGIVWVEPEKLSAIDFTRTGRFERCARTRHRLGDDAL